jgi:hypothetical protein
VSHTIDKNSLTAGVSPSGIPVTRIASLSLRESDRAALRPLVAEIESELATLQAQPDVQGYARVSARLVEHWCRLVKTMALGAPPELRLCPHCGYSINAAATRCLQCWRKSVAHSPVPET